MGNLKLQSAPLEHGSLPALFSALACGLGDINVPIACLVIIFNPNGK